MKKAGPAIALLLLLAAPARADFNAGVVAYLQGDYDTVFTTMQPLAKDAGHGYAQYYLGLMYLKGQGVAVRERHRQGQGKIVRGRTGRGGQAYKALCAEIWSAGRYGFRLDLK